MINPQVKVVEFKLSLNQEQDSKLTSLLDTLKWTWNRGLAILEWNYYQKKLKSYDQVETNWQFNLKNVAIASHLNELRIKKGKKTQAVKVWGDCCHIERQFRIDKSKAWLSSNIEYKPCVELVKPHWMNPVPSEWMGTKDIDIKKAFAQKRNPDNLMLNTKGVMAWVNDYCDKVLQDNWKAYLRGKRKKPRYKRKHDNVKTISLRRSGNNIKLKDNIINIPYIGNLKIKNIDRLPINPNIYKVAITQKATGYYLQLTCDIPVETLKETNKAIAFDIGSTCVYTSVDSDNKYHHARAKRYLAKQKAKLNKLQRKLARQQKGSYNFNKTKKAIAKVHEKIANQRRCYNHKLSHDITDDYNLIVCEDINLQNMTKRAKLKESEDGSYADKNNQKRKSGLNRNLLDNGIGQLRDFIETKALEKRRHFLKVKPQFTSQMCNKCGYIDKENRNNERFNCRRCNHVDHADRNAAKNILLLGLGQSAIATVESLITEFPKLVLGIYPSLVGESYAWVGNLLSAIEGVAPSMDAETIGSKREKQEDTAVSPGGVLKTSQLPYHQGSKQKKASTERRSGSESPKKTRKSSKSRGSKDKGTQEVLATSETPIQLTLWDLGLS